MGAADAPLPWVTFVVGCCALALALTFQFYTTVLDWPLNVGGKPDNSTLAFVPICFELTVLISGLATVAALFLRARLYPGKEGALIRGWRNQRYISRSCCASVETDLTSSRMAAPGGKRRRPDPGKRGAIVKFSFIRLCWPLPSGSPVVAPTPENRAFEYMPDMARGPAYKAYAPNSITRDGLTLQHPVAGTIPRGFSSISLRPRRSRGPGRTRTGEPLSRFTADDRRRQRTVSHLLPVCHGEQGKGDGPISGDPAAPVVRF